MRFQIRIARYFILQVNLFVCLIIGLLHSHLAVITRVDLQFRHKSELYARPGPLGCSLYLLGNYAVVFAAHKLTLLHFFPFIDSLID